MPSTQQKSAFVGDPMKINSNITELTAYLWTDSPDAAQCRLVFPVAKDCSVTNEKDLSPMCMFLT